MSHECLVAKSHMNERKKPSNSKYFGKLKVSQGLKTEVEFSKNSHHVEKPQPADQSVENLGAYNGLLAKFDTLNSLLFFDTLGIIKF